MSQSDRHGINSCRRGRVDSVTVQTDATSRGAPEFDSAVVRRREMARVSPDTHMEEVVVVAPNSSALQHRQAAERTTDSNSLDRILRSSRARDPTVSYSSKLACADQPCDCRAGHASSLNGPCGCDAVCSEKGDEIGHAEKNALRGVCETGAEAICGQSLPKTGGDSAIRRSIRVDLPNLLPFGGCAATRPGCPQARTPVWEPPRRRPTPGVPRGGPEAA